MVKTKLKIGIIALVVFGAIAVCMDVFLGINSYVPLGAGCLAFCYIAMKNVKSEE